MGSSLAELRALLGDTCVRQESFPFSWIPGGIPRGALTEISGTLGSGKSEFLLKFLAENPGVPIAWIEEELTVFPTAFPQRGVGMERVLFVQAGDELAWASRQILRSGLFGIAVISAEHVEENLEVTLRRLQLDAEKSRTSVVLLTEQSGKKGKWTFALQLEVTRRDPIEFRVLKGSRGVLSGVACAR